MKRFIIYLGLIVFAFVDKVPPTLAERAESHHIIWDSMKRMPIAIPGSNFYLEPCMEGNKQHQALFERIYTDPGTMKYWGTGEVRTKADAVAAIKRYASPWMTRQPIGGFIVIYEGRPVMLVGVGLFQAAGVGEFYIMADPTIRGRGVASEVMKVLKHWCIFLNESSIAAFKDYTTGRKARLNTVFATASEENVPSIRLMLKSGFKPLKSLNLYRNGFPSYAQMFSAPSSIKGLKNGELSIIFPTRFMKRKAAFELKIKDIKAQSTKP